MRRESSSLAFLIAVCFLVPMAAVGQMGATTETAAMLASPTLPPEGGRGFQNRVDTVHARFRERHGGSGPEQFGVQCCQITQIPAAAFTARSAFPGWNEYELGYVSRGLGSTSVVWAPVVLPSGVEIEYLDLYYYDNDSTNDIDAFLVAYSGGSPISGSPGITTLAIAQSTGNPGYGYGASSPFSYTVNNNVAYDPAA